MHNFQRLHETVKYIYITLNILYLKTLIKIGKCDNKIKIFQTHHFKEYRHRL